MSSQERNSTVKPGSGDAPSPASSGASVKPGSEDAPVEAASAATEVRFTYHLALWTLTAVSFLIALSAGGLWLAQRPDPGRVEVFVPTPAPVVVHVAGAVSRPGAYELPVRSRAIDAIEAAGGARPDADLSRINLAALVVDGSRLLVPAAAGDQLGGGIDDAVESGLDSSGSESNGESRAGDFVDLNTGSSTELMSLPGIGERRAASIIAFRERNGPITSVDDLLEIDGIGSGIVELLRPHVVQR